jgi:hypothetical protein
MLIIAILYVCAVWLVFFRFKLLPWNWPWRSESPGPLARCAARGR